MNWLGNHFEEISTAAQSSWRSYGHCKVVVFLPSVYYTPSSACIRCEANTDSSGSVLQGYTPLPLVWMSLATLSLAQAHTLELHGALQGAFWRSLQFFGVLGSPKGAVFTAGPKVVPWLMLPQPFVCSPPHVHSVLIYPVQLLVLWAPGKTWQMDGHTIMWEKLAFMCFSPYFSRDRILLFHIHVIYLLSFSVKFFPFLMVVPLESVFDQLSSYCEFTVFCHVRLTTGVVWRI